MSSKNHNDLAVVFVAHKLESSFAASAARISSQTTCLGWARSLCAPLGGVQTPFGHRNDWVAEPGVTADAAPFKLECRVNTSILCVSGRLLKQRAVLCLFGCQGTMRGMRSERVVPDSIRVETGLECINSEHGRRSPQPALHIAEDALDFGVQLPCADSAPDMSDAEQAEFTAEAPSELAPVVGDDVSRHNRLCAARVTHYCEEIFRCRPVRKRPQCNDLPREAVNDRSDLNLHPEHAVHGDVEVPDMVRSSRMLNVLRRACHSLAALSVLARLRWLFLEHSSHRRSADLDACADDVSRDRPCAELGLGEGLTDFVDEPTNSVVQPIPWRRVQDVPCANSVLDSALPVSDCVGMDDEALAGFLHGPSAQLHDLEDLSALGRGVVGALMCRLSLPLGSEYSQLALEERGVVVNRIPLTHQPHQRGRMGEHSGPRRHRRTHEKRGNTVGHRPRRPVAGAQIIPFSSMSSARATGLANPLLGNVLVTAIMRRNRTLRTSPRERTNSWPTPVGGLGGGSRETQGRRAVSA